MPHVMSNQISLYYERHLPENPCGAAPLVLIRGLGTQMIQWPDGFVDYFLDQGLEVILFDNRDVGLSQKIDAAGVPDIEALMMASRSGVQFPVPYGIEDMALDVIGLMDELGIEKANIYGMSLGGMVAQHLAFSHPTRMAHVVCVMSSSGNPDLPPPDAGSLAPSNAEDEAALIDDLTESMARYMSPKYPTSEADRRAMATKVIARMFYPQGVIRQMAAVISDGSRVERLATISVPFMVIHGDSDALLVPACGEDIAAHVPNAEWHLIDGMGHDIGPGIEQVIGPLVVKFLGLA